MVVVFSSNFTDVTARVEAIAANTSAGDAAAFLDGSSNAYLRKGSTDNVVQVGTAAVSSVATEHQRIEELNLTIQG